MIYLYVDLHIHIYARFSIDDLRYQRVSGELLGAPRGGSTWLRSRDFAGAGGR